MKVVVKTIFRDKYTRKVYKLDDEIDVTDKRYEEIKQYVEKIEEKKKRMKKRRKQINNLLSLFFRRILCKI